MTRIGDQFEKVIVILSSGRTGTTALARIFDQAYESVCGKHEPKPSRRLRREGFAYLAGRRSLEQMVESLTRARTRLCAEIDEPIYVESNPYLLGYMEVLDSVFGQPQVIHVTRDPRTLIPSALNFGVQRGLKRFFSTFVPHWMVKPEEMHSSPERTWSQMSEVERFAWYWRIANEHLDRATAIYGDRYRRVRYEDLFNGQADNLRDLADWMGLHERPGALEPMLSRRVNRSRAKIMPAWPDWSPQDRESLERQCAKLMRIYGYEEPSFTASADSNG